MSHDLLASVQSLCSGRSNETSYVSEEKKKRIRDAIKKPGYRPNQAARVLKGDRAKMIGLIIRDLADLFLESARPRSRSMHLRTVI
jgi:DNA-binding LacI/PurR family transcriptional regulator